MHVLVLDDNPDDRELVRREVLALFPDATIRADGQNEASFEAAMRDIGTYDLVSTDYALRYTDGVTVLRRIKALRPELPVIMFTGTGSEEVAVEAMREGLDDYVVKSARQLPRLRASIRAVVEGARGRAALRAREAELAEALRQKDVLLRELHHRVRNNLQTAIALLRLRARGRDEGTQRDLRAVADRLNALAEVQARIYAAGDLDAVDMRALLSDMARSLIEVYGNGHVGLELTLGGPLPLDVRRAAPLALVLYELMLSALTHGFDGREGETLTVGLEPGTGDALAVLSIADNGQGSAPGRDGDGLGWPLIRQLAAEAGAALDVGHGPDGRGTRVTLRLAREG